jgi:hypothetical protein
LAAAVTFRTAVTATPFKVAVIVTCLSAVTANVVTVKLAESWPDETPVVAGTDATAESELVSVTVPPVVSFRVTVPVTVTAVVPPCTLIGFKTRRTGKRVTPVRVATTRRPRAS